MYNYLINCFKKTIWLNESLKYEAKHVEDNFEHIFFKIRFCVHYQTTTSMNV